MYENGSRSCLVLGGDGEDVQWESLSARASTVSGGHLFSVPHFLRNWWLRL